MTRPERTLRRTAWSLQALGVVAATAAVLIRWIDWGGFEWAEVEGLLGLLLLFWSPYAALAVTTRYLGRGRARLLLLIVASVLVVAWDVYWRIVSMLPDPDVVLDIMAPVLITGTQWIGVVVTLALVMLLPSPRPRESS